jgi:hypothetical protein
MSRTIIISILLLLWALVPSKLSAQQIINGTFDQKEPPIGFYGGTFSPEVINYNMYVAQSGQGMFPQKVFLRIINYPISPYTLQDSLDAYSAGFFQWAFFDSTDNSQFGYSSNYPQGLFLDYFKLGGRTQFEHTPFPNRISLCFIHYNMSRGWGPQYKLGV